MRPEPAEVFFQSPAASRFQVTLAEIAKVDDVFVREMVFTEQPELSRPFQPSILPALKFLVLHPADLVHRFIEMLADMKLVVHDFSLRSQLASGFLVGARHVHGNRSNLLALAFRQRFPELFRRLRGPILGDFEDPRFVQIDHQGNVALPPPKALFIQADVFDLIDLTSGKAPRDAAFQDGMHGLPIQSQQIGRLLDAAARLQHPDRECLEHQCEPRVLVGPGHGGRLHATFRAGTTRDPRSNDGLELHRVQVPPTAFRSQVMPPAGLAAIWTNQLPADKFKDDFYPAALQRNVHFLDFPVGIQAE